MKKFACLFLIVLSQTAFSEEIFRIEIGKDYKSYSQSDLQRRVWDLERAVWQLQQRVFQLEANKGSGSAESWVCTIRAINDVFTGTGASKAVAISKVTDACKAGRGGDGFFCKDPKCEQ